VPRVVVAGKIHPSGVALLKNAPGIQLDIVEEVSVGSYAPFMPTADALLIRTQPLTAQTIAQAPNLKIVSRHGVGYDAVDVAALDARKIPLAIVGDITSGAVAEHAMMLILATARRVVLFDRKTRAGEWDYRNSLDAVEIQGKTLLIVGFGRIGRRLARLAASFEMRVIAHDPYLTAQAISDAGGKPVSDFDEALAAADVVSLHVPGAQDGYLLDAQRLARMKSTAIIVNTARGGLIDEAALDEALNAGRIFGAGIDVFEEEPPAPDNPLLTSQRTILSPHNAGLTAGGAQRMAMVAAQNILDFFNAALNTELVVNRDQIGFGITSM
jgi:D-3-phosphoglycerate dehydrogenase